MGGIVGVCSKNECAADLFFGTDYHSHLGTRRGGMAVFDGHHFNRAIHNIENTPFKTKFEADLREMTGKVGIGCISDSGPQPLIFYSKIGVFALVTVGRINNKNQLAAQLVANNNALFSELSKGRINDTELVASLICMRDNIADGIAYARSQIEGSMTMLVCADGGIYAARDNLGRTPLSIGKREDGYCIGSESFVYINLGYKQCRELGAGEIVFLNAETIETIMPANEKMRVCTFLWTYYGYPTSDYEGVNVERMRYSCGRSLADQDSAEGFSNIADYVAGVPDSGTAHAIGYAGRSGVHFARPLIKYTPAWTRSFMPREQQLRELIARMKLIPINSLIEGRKLLFIDDSIVRGTQMRGIVDFLFACKAKELHMRTACPPVLYSCKFLNFSRSTSENDLISRRTILKLEGAADDAHVAEYVEYGGKKYKALVEDIRRTLNLTTLEYHSLDGLLSSIGIDKRKLCTYCWNGEE